MSDREQAIKDVADYLHIGAPAVELGLSDHSRDTDFWACPNLLADDVAQRERVIALERALREILEVVSDEKGWGTHRRMEGSELYAETELPSVPQAELEDTGHKHTKNCFIEDILICCEPNQTDLLAQRDSARGRAIGHAITIRRLEAALAKSEAREAELKAEIAKMQMDNVIDYKAACEQHAANYEALERSHKALLEYAKQTTSLQPCDVATARQLLNGKSQ